MFLGRGRGGRLLEAVFLEALREAGAPGVDVLGPEVSGRVEEHEPRGDPEPEAGAAGQAQDGAVDGLALLVGDVGGHDDAVEQPGENGADERAMDEVDGEGVLAEPEEVTVGERALDRVGEVDAERDEDHAEPGVRAWDIGVLGEDEERCVVEPLGPRHELGVVTRVRCEEEAEREESRREDQARPAVGGHPVDVSRVLGQVRQERTEEELHAESSCGG